MQPFLTKMILFTIMVFGGCQEEREKRKIGLSKAKEISTKALPGDPILIWKVLSPLSLPTVEADLIVYESGTAFFSTGSIDKVIWQTKLETTTLEEVLHSIPYAKPGCSGNAEEVDTPSALLLFPHGSLWQGGIYSGLAYDETLSRVFDNDVFAQTMYRVLSQIKNGMKSEWAPGVVRADILPNQQSVGAREWPLQVIKPLPCYFQQNILLPEVEAYSNFGDEKMVEVKIDETNCLVRLHIPLPMDERINDLVRFFLLGLSDYCYPESENGLTAPFMAR